MLLEKYINRKDGILMSQITFPLLSDRLLVWESHLSLSSQRKTSAMIIFI
jgi:hypothetical protein